MAAFLNRLRRGLTVERARSWLGAIAVAVLAVVAFASVRVTGGSPNPLNHLGYVPIVLAAYLFGFGGGALTGLIMTLLLGPAAGLLGFKEGVEGLWAWTIRGVLFTAIGGVTGYLFERVRRAMSGWQRAALETAQRERDGMVALARGAEAKDTDTGDHVVRCQVLSEALARAVGLARETSEAIGWSAILHDVGKLHVPDRILLKPGPLTAPEWQIMRQHPLWGEEILGRGAGFETARRIARWHHENFDGSGYPDGLRGERTPLEARIVRVCDAYDAMTHLRPYKPARSPEWAMDELSRYAGSQFDPDLVRLFIALLEADDALRMGSLARRLASSIGRKAA